LGLLGRCSTIWATPPVLSAFVIFLFLSPSTPPQGFVLAKQVFYCLSHISNPFLLWLFWKWSLMNCLPGLALNHDLPIWASQVARITGVRH
jgi:hypothetical protein